MGSSEDDRIRSKNRYQNEAWKIYEEMLAAGHDINYILSNAEFTLSNATDPYRIEVMNTMIHFVRRINEGVKKNNTNK